MKRNEEIKKQANIYTDNASNYAEWSDDGGWSETNDIELVEKAFIEGAKWADNTMIEKACEWLDCFLERTIQRPSQISLQTSVAIDIIEVRRHETIKMLLYDFRKAMEE